MEDSVLKLWEEVFIGIKHYIKKINHECKLEEREGPPDCEEFSKIKFNYGKIMIELNLLVLIICH